ncbi:hypothetical protein EE612_023482, partial [Oryza sativa]
RLRLRRAPPRRRSTPRLPRGAGPRRRITPRRLRGAGPRRRTTPRPRRGALRAAPLRLTTRRRLLRVAPLRRTTRHRRLRAAPRRRITPRRLRGAGPRRRTTPRPRRGALRVAPRRRTTRHRRLRAAPRRRTTPHRRLLAGPRRQTTRRLRPLAELPHRSTPRHRVPVDVLPPDGKLLASFRTSLGSFLAAHRSPLPREECGRRDEGPHGPPRAPLPDLHRGREQWRAPRLRPWPVDAHNLVIHLDNARVAEQHPREKKREEKKETRHVAAQASELCSLATARLDGCFLQPQIGSARRAA